MTLDRNERKSMNSCSAIPAMTIFHIFCVNEGMMPIFERFPGNTMISRVPWSHFD